MSPPIEGRQLRAFATLARTGSFTLAARELHLTQSAISHSMKALENDVGCRLFDRVGKKVLLTEAGEQLLHHTHKIMAEMDTARSSLQHLGKWGQGRLRLGASTTACQHILPHVLREFKTEFPQTSLAIEPGDTSQALEALQANRIDLALTLEPPGQDQFHFQPLFTDELNFIVCPSHAWAQRGHATQAEIPRQQYILYSKASFTFRMVERFFREDDVVLNTVMELGSMEAIKELVKLGLGASVLAPWIAREEIAGNTLVALPLGRRKLKRTWGIIHWRKRRLKYAEERFVALCRATTDNLMAAQGELVRTRATVASIPSSTLPDRSSFAS